MEKGSDQEHLQRHDRADRLLETMAVKMDRLQDEVRAFFTSQVLMGENLDKMALQQREIVQVQRDMIQAQQEMIQAQRDHAQELHELAKRTDEKFSETNDKLNALITFFEQPLREHGGEKR